MFMHASDYAEKRSFVTRKLELFFFVPQAMK